MNSWATVADTMTPRSSMTRDGQKRWPFQPILSMGWFVLVLSLTEVKAAVLIPTPGWRGGWEQGECEVTAAVLIPTPGWRGGWEQVKAAVLIPTPGWRGGWEQVVYSNLYFIQTPSWPSADEPKIITTKEDSNDGDIDCKPMEKPYFLQF
ncbi:hypothetical protein Bbelb_056130 [Branchiostoma belcheri]|nr:hypothetical protein Bbelb_056130 [Branchiostoma belcheri]